MSVNQALRPGTVNGCHKSWHLFINRQGLRELHNKATYTSESINRQDLRELHNKATYTSESWGKSLRVGFIIN